MIQGVSLAPQARRDIIEAAVHIAGDNPDAADRFIAAVEETLAALLRQPSMGAPRPFADSRLSGMRMFPVTGFTAYLIFYRPQDGRGILVVRVLHGARDIGAIFEPE
jgi:plasmid stabilization system protein ParE